MGIVPGIPIFPWWLVLLQGIVTLILGMLLLYYPLGTIVLLVTFLGAYWFLNGIVGLVSLATDSTNRGWKLLFAVLGIIAGIAVLAYPYYSAFLIPATFIFLIGFWGIIMGALGIFAAFKGGGWGAGITGALLVIFGLIALSHPLVTVTFLVVLLGMLGIIGGIVAITGGLVLRSNVGEVTTA